MKKGLLLATIITVSLVGPAGFAQVTGTLHDMSGTFTAGGGQQMCAFCHTPHNANIDAILAGRAPLWNQDLPTTGSYGEYTSDSFDASDLVAIDTGVYSESLLCMSCHDGTVAPGNFYNDPNPEPATSSATVTGNAILGTDLSNDHPVNFTYASSVTNGDTGLVAEATVATNGFLDPTGRVQCSSCHDVHDQATTKDPNTNFMKDTLEGSVLCLNCHIK